MTDKEYLKELLSTISQNKELAVKNCKSSQYDILLAEHNKINVGKAIAYDIIREHIERYLEGKENT